MTDTETQVSLESVNAKLDMIGNQMNWVCENLVGLFAFVQSVSNSGGGIRGIMAAMKQAPPQLHPVPQQEEQPDAG